MARKSIMFTRRMSEDLAEAVRFLRLCKSWGHGPGGEGTRLAGFYYVNSEAQAAEAFPAHAMGAIRNLLFELEKRSGGDE